MPQRVKSRGMERKKWGQDLQARNVRSRKDLPRGSLEAPVLGSVDMHCAYGGAHNLAAGNGWFLLLIARRHCSSCPQEIVPTMFQKGSIM